MSLPVSAARLGLRFHSCASDHPTATSPAPSALPRPLTATSSKFVAKTRRAHSCPSIFRKTGAGRRAGSGEVHENPIALRRDHDPGRRPLLTPIVVLAFVLGKAFETVSRGLKPVAALISDRLASAPPRLRSSRSSCSAPVLPRGPARPDPFGAALRARARRVRPVDAARL